MTIDVMEGACNYNTCNTVIMLSKQCLGYANLCLKLQLAICPDSFSTRTLMRSLSDSLSAFEIDTVSEESTESE